MKLFSSLFLLTLASNIYALPTSCPINVANGDQAAIVGLARDLKSGEPLYCEYHYEQSPDSRMVVEYRDLAQKIIARKELDYSPGLLRPDVMQEDMRHGELRAVSLNQTLSNGINVQYRKPNKESIKAVNLSVSDKLVVDAGFDHAIREHWDGLLVGEKLKMNFLSPMHLRKIALTIELNKKDLCNKQSYDKSSQTCFLIHPTNIILNAFVKPLALIYDRERQRLMVYKGSVNITSEDGSTIKAVIEYQYNDKV